MSNNFFDKSLLETESQETTEYSSLKHYKDLMYNIKKTDGAYSFSCEINEMRLNQGELKGLIVLNETKSFLTDNEVLLLNYIISKVTNIQTIYRMINDVETIFNYLQDAKNPIFFNEVETKITSDEKKLDMDIFLDNESNVVIDIANTGGFLFGKSIVYYLDEGKVNPVCVQVPLKIYKEFIEGNNMFSIETFFDIKDTIIPLLQKHHNVRVSKEIVNLTNLEIKQKQAGIALEIGKSAHFISLSLKYKIGEELFDVDKYKYLETVNWPNKENVIKIMKENSGLVKYVSDLSLSEYFLEDLFEGIRMRFNISEKSPFSAMVPIASMDTFVNKILPKAIEMFEVVYKNGQKLTLDEGRVEFEIDTNLRRNINLFEFKVRFKIGEEFFDLEFLKNLMLQNKKYVQLRDGSTINIENIREINKWIEFLNKFEFKKSGSSYKAETQTALELDEFLKDMSNKNLTSNDEYRNIIQELKEKSPVEPIKLPKVKTVTLRDYQKEGVYWIHFLKKYGFGGILADEMGLGKTIQALTILEMEKGNGVNIVICPKSLIYNWEAEIKKYYPNFKVLIVDKDSSKRRQLIESSKDYDIIITSYSLIQKDYIHYTDLDVKFNYMILDEAHYVKNMKTLSSKAVRVLNAKRKLLLTGTPLENNLDELYGTFELIMPGYLGSKLDFRRDFVSKIERNNTIALEILQAKIRPFILRRTKSEVLKELPDKQEQIVYNEMTNKQVTIYNEVLKRLKSDVNDLVDKQGFNKSRIQILSALLKLRQICNHPSLADDSFKGKEDISGKHEQFQELLQEVVEGGEKVLVFSQFTKMLDIFEDDLKEKGITFVRLDGSTKNRQDVVNSFNEDDNIKVFLISLKAGGVGLNLTAASSVFLYDPWWNPMAERQAVDRAHRMGQTKKVNIYKFITKNSIEEKILKLQERKGNLFENLVVENNAQIKRLEWEDLMELFE
ncbi:MAG: DEAD/DEAH box helicase family protein [Nanoarchaeales archaeon]|nr:DEAD/DEAH box helicase family protein [Nanoarchaeales archaeon]